MTEQEPAQPKLTASQKADKALEAVGELMDWRAGLLGADGPGSMTRIEEDAAAIAQDHQTMLNKVADLEALVLAGREPGGTPLVIAKDDELAKRVDVLEETLAGIHRLVTSKYDNDAAVVMEGAVKQAQQDAIAAGSATSNLAQRLGNEVKALQPLFARVHQLEEWQAAILDEDEADGEGRVEDMVRTALGKVTADRGSIQYHPAVAGQRQAAHVLGLIVALKKHVGAIGKERRASHSGGQYDFRGVDDAMDAVGNACNVIGIVPPRATVVSERSTTHELGGRIWTTVHCVMRYTFQSPVDGSEWSTEGIGEGRDLADKATTKAMAAALKYALFHGLCIPIQGMNVDAETEHPVVDSRPADQGSHEYRQWENQQEQAEQREYARQAAPVAQRKASQFDSAEDAAAYCRQRGDAVGTMEELNAIVTWADQHKLMDIPVNGVPLGTWLVLAAKTKPPLKTAGVTQ